MYEDPYYKDSLKGAAPFLGPPCCFSNQHQEQVQLVLVTPGHRPPASKLSVDPASQLPFLDEEPSPGNFPNMPPHMINSVIHIYTYITYTHTYIHTYIYTYIHTYILTYIIVHRDNRLPCRDGRPTLAKALTAAPGRIKEAAPGHLRKGRPPTPYKPIGAQGLGIL